MNGLVTNVLRRKERKIPVPKMGGFLFTSSAVIRYGHQPIENQAIVRFCSVLQDMVTWILFALMFLMIKSRFQSAD